MDEKAALKLVMSVIKKVEKTTDLAKALEIAIIRKKDKKFERLTENQIRKFL